MKIRYIRARKRWQLDARKLVANYQPTFDTKLEAEAHSAKLIADKVNGTFINPKDAVNFQFCVEKWLLNNELKKEMGDIKSGELNNRIVSARKLEEFTYGNKRLFDTKVTDLEAGALETEILPQIRLYQNARQKAANEKSSPATAHKLFQHFKNIFKYSKKAGLLQFDPARDLEHKLKEGHYDVEDITASRNGKKSLSTKLQARNIKKIIYYAPKNYKQIIEMVAYTGIRVGELRAANWDQIYFGNKTNGATIYIDRAVKKDGTIGEPKTPSGYRTIALDDFLVTMLKKWKEDQPEKQKSRGLIFPTSEGNIASADNWRNRGIYKACKNADIDTVNLLELRHHFASILIFNSKFSEATVTEMMGHTDINFTKKQYATWIKSAKRDKDVSAELTKARKAA